MTVYLRKTDMDSGSGKSTLTQLLAHLDDILSGLCENKDTDSIYLDYAKAFDKVDHGLLIDKLVRYGFHTKLIKWIHSFLSDRKQVVLVNGVRSDEASVRSGVPQGSVLGPVLFLIFINDLETVLNSSTVRFFADDTRISHRIEYSTDREKLQQDLSNIVFWSKENNMMLHEQKFELMVHKANPNSIGLQLPFSPELYYYDISNSFQLEATDSLRDLGVRITSDLSWSTQIKSLVSRGRSASSWVLSVFKTRDPNTMLTLYKSYVRSNVEYCSPLWHPSKIEDIESIEGVQRFFTAKIDGCRQLTYWERLIKLGLMSLQRRRERFILLTMWKILHNRLPNDLLISFRSPSRLGIQSIIPSLPRSDCRQRNRSLYDASFAVIGPKLWNMLPRYINVIEKEVSFKNELTKFILKLPDQPPVQGYPRNHGNSLVDVAGLHMG